MSKKTRNALVFIAFTFPALIMVLMATDVPFVMNLYYSLFDWNGISRSMKFVGLANFVKIFTNDRVFMKAAKFNVRFAVYYVIIVNILSLLVANALAKPKRVNTFGRAFYYVPYIISLTALSMIWKFIFGPGFDSLSELTGWDFFSWSWIGTPKLAFYVVVIMTVWQNVGFYMVNYIAGLVAVPEEVLEAAMIDGATNGQTFMHVKLPLIMPSISICMLMSLTFAFKLFDVIMVFTQGGPANSTVTVAYNIYKEAFVNNKYGLATAKSLVFFVVVMMVTVVQLIITKRKEVELA